jgi:hypothetical protein
VGTHINMRPLTLQILSCAPSRIGLDDLKIVPDLTAVTKVTDFTDFNSVLI